MKIVKTLLIFLTLVTIVASILLVPKQIKVDSITCNSQYGPCSEEIVNDLSGFIGLSLHEAKRKLDDVLQKQTLINDYSVQFKLPSVLHINVVEKKPQFSIYSFESGEYYLTDKDGYIIKIEKQNNLPFIKIQSFFGKPGEKIQDKYLFSLDITYRLFSSYQIKETEFSNDTLIAMMPEGIKVIFPTEGDKEVLMGALSMIMSRLNDSVKESKIDISQIDLRFKNPVLK